MTRDDAYFDSGLGYSDMKVLLESPAKYRHRINNPSTPTDAMVFGQLVHAFVLDQPVLEYVAKDWDGRTKDGKERAAQVASEGLTIVSVDDYERAKKVAAAVREKAGHLFTGGEAEVVGHREVDGVKIRARADYLTPTGIVDLKTTRNADYRLFARDAIQYGYQIQAANYIDTFQRSTFTLVAVETRAPYLVSIHEFDEFALDWGREQIAEALRIYRNCMESLLWPDFLRTETQVITRPAWSFDDEIEIPA